MKQPNEGQIDNYGMADRMMDRQGAIECLTISKQRNEGQTAKQRYRPTVARDVRTHL